MPSNYPTSLDTTTSLSTAVNGVSTTLNGDHTSSTTTITVQSTAGASTAGYVYIDSEVIKYTGISPTTLTGCTRGSDGTSAASHSNSAVVKFGLVADHHNALVTAVIGAQTKLGTNTNGASATSIDAAQLAAGSSATITNLTASGTVAATGAITSSATITASGGVVTGFGLRDSRGQAGANVKIKLGEFVITSATASVTFSSIDQGFRHLVIECDGTTDNAVAGQIVVAQFNGDTGANYDQYIFSIHANPPVLAIQAENYGAISVAVGLLDGSTGIRGAFTTIIRDYTSTTHHKNIESLGMHQDAASAGNTNRDSAAGRWRSNSAITSILIKPNAGNFLNVKIELWGQP